MKHLKSALAALTALTIASPMVLSSFAETVSNEPYRVYPAATETTAWAQTTICDWDTHLTFTEQELTIAVGQCDWLQIHACLDAQFSIADESVARLTDAHGVYTGFACIEGVSPGETTITAVYGNETATAVIRVTEAGTTTIVTPVTTTAPIVTTVPFPIDETEVFTTTTSTPSPWPEIQFEYGGVSGSPHDTFTFDFLGYDDGLEYGPGESPIQFTVSDESVVRITRIEGMTIEIELLEAGSAIIRGTTPDGKYAECRVYVSEPVEPEPLPTSDVEFSMETAYLDPGETVEVELLGYEGNLYYDYDGIHDLNLFNCDESVVRIVNAEGNKFTLEGVSTGVTDVYAYFDNGYGASMRIFVYPLPEMKLHPVFRDVYPDDYFEVRLTGYAEYLTEYDPYNTLVQYEFDDPELVEVIEKTDHGLWLRAAKSGTTTIHATVPDGRTDEVQITVLPDTFRFSMTECECYSGEYGFLVVHGGDAVFSVEDDGVIEVISAEDNVLEFRGLTPGETIVTATQTDGDAVITARVIVSEMIVTTTCTTTTTGFGLTTPMATETTCWAETGTTGFDGTEPFVTTAPVGDLPQTGNNDMTGLLVLIGTFALTGTGLTVLKRSGIMDENEQ